VGDCAQSRVVVKASPCSAFEVVEAELALHFLVVTLDTPAELQKSNELFDAGTCGQVGEMKLRRLL